MKFLTLILIMLLAGCGSKWSLRPQTINGVELEPQNELEGSLRLLMPRGFCLMGRDVLEQRYPRDERPTRVYANASGSINVAIHQTDASLDEAGLADFHKNQEEFFNRSYKKHATWFQSGLVTVNGKQWVQFDFRSPSKKSDIRNLLMATSHKGKLLLVSFNIDEDEEEKWLEPGRAVISSLSLNDNEGTSDEQQKS